MRITHLLENGESGLPHDSARLTPNGLPSPTLLIPEGQRHQEDPAPAHSQRVSGRRLISPEAWCHVLAISYSYISKDLVPHYPGLNSSQVYFLLFIPSASSLSQAHTATCPLGECQTFQSGSVLLVNLILHPFCQRMCILKFDMHELQI